MLNPLASARALIPARVPCLSRRLILSDGGFVVPFGRPLGRLGVVCISYVTVSVFLEQKL
jgi:hypothetical protein